MNSPLYLIIRREYLERVRSKSFILSTLLMPLLMLLLMGLPVIIAYFNTPTVRSVVVSDATGVLAPRLTPDSDMLFVVSNDESLDQLRQNDDYDIVVMIGEDAVANPSAQISIYSHESMPLGVESTLTGKLNRAIEDQRLEAYDVGDVRAILDEVHSNASFTTIRIDNDSEESTSSVISYFVSLLADMMLYMFILIYGQQVMTSIVDEKANRVLEIIVSSVSPKTLMLGKISGIGLVAITQILIWGVLLSGMSAFALPFVSASVPAEAVDPEIASALAVVSDPGKIIGLFAAILAFFIGGYLFYSTMYAAIGSACDNIQDASQLATLPTVPIIVACVLSLTVIEDPNSSLAVWVSMIPFTSPMTMMARMPFNIPSWQIYTSLAILYTSFLLMIWLCAKIYRVGIFMYGKKPTFTEILRWSRYK